LRVARKTPRRDGEVVYLTVAAPDYLRRPLALLADRLGDRFRLVTGDASFDPSVRTRVTLPNVSRVRNRFLLGNRLVWQAGTVRVAVRAEVAILVLNPRVLNNWPILLARRALGRPTVLRGHVWSRRGRSSRTEPVRNVLRRLADVFVAYTESEARELRTKTPGARVVAAPNALYSRSEMGAAGGEQLPDDFIYVGRLVAEKKPRLLVEAFLAVHGQLPPETRLVVVGDGPQRAELEKLVDAGGGDEIVRFEGHLADPEALRSRYGRAVASVSPGCVGLSLIQSLAFGVPMIVSRDEPHPPEIEAAVDGVTSVMFETDSVEDLGRTLLTMMSERDVWASRREELARLCADRYSAEVMVDRIVEAVDLARATRHRRADSPPE
jgi:glycosyltransferase involved in cell wall biosynthesis